MWKASLNGAIRELRFVLKAGKEHHGTWRFVQAALPEIRMLNQNTMFSVTELNDNFTTDSAIHISYGDVANTTEMIHTAGLTSKQVESLLQTKVTHGLTMERQVPASNVDRHLPISIVEAHKYVKYQDDAF